ncbi:MAG: HNH endonuclease [Bacteroidales bacterium]|nr:HNH endonuclease [Bacteroidales bacterium]
MIMNYEKLYYAIINKALRKQISGQRFKGDGFYYEFHHITPRSFGGSDEDKNLVLLTTKEHYLCHWLLVKRYDLNSSERKKMIKAWYMMAAVGFTKRPKRNMNTYAKYRNEMGETMSEAQSGNRNSQYGKHWFTSIDTGESKNFFEKPNDRWIEGRWLFNGQTSELKFKVKQTQKFKVNSTQRIKKNVSHKFISLKMTNKIKQTELETKNMWNEYHSGNYKSLREYEKQISISLVALRNRFIKYTPIFLHMRKKGKEFPSDKSLVGVYE